MIPWEHYRKKDLPDLLLRYRVVVDYPTLPEKAEDTPADEVCLTGIRTLYHKQNHIFEDRHTALEVSYQEARKAAANERAKQAEARYKEWEATIAASVPSEWKGEGPCPVCKREASVNVEDLGKWKRKELIEGLLASGQEQAT